MPPPDRRFFTSYSLRISFVHPCLKNRKHRRNRRDFYRQATTGTHATAIFPIPEAVMSLTTTDKQDSYLETQTAQEKGFSA